MDAGSSIDPQTGLRSRVAYRPFPVGPSTIAELWDHRDPESVAVIDGDRVWSTRALHHEVERVARCLAAADVKTGERVAWILANDATSLISLLATLRVGGLWVGVSARSTNAERAVILDDASPALVFDALPTGDPQVALPPSVPAEADAAIAYTSGTTGRPKGAVHAQQQLLYPAAAAMATEDLGPATRIGTPLPLSTLNIVLLGPLTALACGGTAVMMAQTDAEGFAREVAEYNIVRALVVPTIVHDLVQADIDPTHLKGLDRLVVGGAGADRVRMQAAQAQLGVDLITSYGLSEAPTGVARMRVGDAGATPLPGIDVQVESDGEITLAPATTGPWAGTWQGTHGYFGAPDGTAELWRGGRLHTGDAGTLDADGRLLVTGRVSEMINRGGSTIAPAEVESALLSIDGVSDAAVFAIDDERLGQVPAAAIVGATETDAIALALRETLSGYKVPVRWLVVDSLPRNANGKVDRRALREHLT